MTHRQDAFALVAPTLAVVVSLTAGCLDMENQDEVASDRLEVTSSNRISSNRISSNRISSNRISSNRISSNSLAADMATLGDLVETDGGREYLSYLIRCALPAGLDLVVLASDGVTESYRFARLIGLAPDWETRALTLGEQRWLSACMLAHVNAFGVSVPISLRGPHPALQSINNDEKQDFPVKEAAFYGNLFEDVDGDGLADPFMYACHGKAKPKYADSEYLQRRICADADPDSNGLTQCDFVAVGDCGTDSGAAEWACEMTGNNKTGYQSCWSQVRTSATSWPSTAEQHEEVITVFLMQ